MAHAQRIYFFGLLLLILTVGSTPALAQNQTNLTLIAKAGLDGNCKDGFWIPVRVILENVGPQINGQVEAVVEDISGNEIVYAYPIDMPSASRKEIFLYVFPTGYIGEINLKFLQGKQLIATATSPITCQGSEDRIFGVLSENPTPFFLLADIDPPNGNAIVAQLKPEDLPDKFQGWEALDVLVISGIDTGLLTQDQQNALSSWVAGGGKLIIAGGADWQKTAAGMTELLPLLPSSTTKVTSVSSLVKFANTSQPIDEPPVEVLMAAGELTPDAQVLLQQDDLPIIIYRQIGQGSVYYLTVDPRLMPLRGWDGMTELYTQLLAYHPNQPVWSHGISDWYSANQLAASLGGIKLPSAVLICSFLGLYVLVLGPANYVFLRLLKRRELAWISIPLTVVGFSLVAFILGSLSRGQQPIVNQQAIVQVWPGLPNAQVDGVIGLYSPARRTYTLSLLGNYLTHPIPYDYAPINKNFLFLEGADGVTIPDLRLEAGGVHPLTFKGSISSPAIDANLILTTDESNATLTGNLTNSSEKALDDVMLLFPGGVLPIGEFDPGEILPINVMLTRAQLLGEIDQTPFNFPLTSGTSLNPPPYAYQDSYDTTIQDILGTSNYYDDKEINRRYLLLSAFLNPYSYSHGKGRGAGIYLFGWSDNSPVDLELSSQGYTAQDTTLYIVALNYELNHQAPRLQLPPAMFSWTSLQSNINSPATPYDNFLGTGDSYSLEFSLAKPLAYRKIIDLTMNLTNPIMKEGASGLDVSLWDFSLAEWVPIPEANWGQTSILEPERFVGPGGVIRVQIINPNNPMIDIERSDFTLSIEQGAQE